MRRADRWLMAELSRILKVIEDAMEVTKTRTAANAAVYLMLNAWRRYVRRRGGSIGPAAKDFVKAWAVALSPFAPFTAEEMNRIMGGKDFVARSSWPVVKLDGLGEVLIEEEVLDSLVEDVKRIIQVTGKQPNSVKVLVAPQNFTKIYIDILHDVSSECLANLSKSFGLVDDVKEYRVDIGKWVREFPQEVNRNAAANLVRRFVDLARDLFQRYSEIAMIMGRPLNLKLIDKRDLEDALSLLVRDLEEVIKSVITKERAVYEEEIGYLRRELGCEVVVTEADYAHPDPMRKALQAIPLRPGVVVS
jgi:leucyl-tRNA synthetase